jgi:signal transduction histidine kinase
MKRAPVVFAACACGAAALAAEWMRAPGWVLPAGLSLLAALAVAAARALWRGGQTRGARWPAAVGAAAAVVLALATLAATYRLQRIERHWPAVREAAVERASRRLGAELNDAVSRAWTLAERGSALLTLPPERAFAALERQVAGGGPSHGVVLFDRAGRPRAWAGLQRLPLRPSGPDLSAVTTPFYLELAARRQTGAGTSVATVLLARAATIPVVGEALAERFESRTGVGLQFFDPRTAPADPDVFDYVRPNGNRRDTLFAVRPIPPEQGTALSEARSTVRQVALGLALLLVLAAGAVSVRADLSFGWRAAAVGAALVLVARAPLGETFGPGTPFWAGTYYLPLLGPWSSSAGALLIASTAVFALACALWRRGLPATPSRIVLAVLITLVAPYLVQALARGITPPARGVAGGLWQTWQAAIAVPSAAIVLLAASLVRGREVPARAGLRPWAAGAIALGAAAAGLWLWEPGKAWPPWYPYLWAPALLLVLRPMPFRSTIATLAVVAGSSAALLTWGATTDGRMALATRDLESLGDRPDPLAVALLDRLVHEMPIDSLPRSAGDLFTLWRKSALGAQGYPAEMALWEPDGTRALALELADLDLPADMVHQVAHEAAYEGLPLVRPILRVPGLHGIAAIPVGTSGVVTVAVGPRSRLVPPSRLALFLLLAARDPDPPFDVALAPPGPTASAADSAVLWERDGWALRGERSIVLPEGLRHVHAIVDLRSPSALLQRGLLTLALDVALFVALWLAVEGLAGRAGPALRQWWPAARRSLRARLTVSLALFFVIPTLAFAAWSFGRLEDEFQSARVLLLQRSLRDAAAILARDTARADSALSAAARQLDAELLLSRGGVLVASSAPVLQDLGLVDWLVPGSVYARLAYGDEAEMTWLQEAVPAPTVVGYRLLDRGEPGEADLLATPEFLSDRALRRGEGDLGIAVLVASLLGCLAALVLSGVAARALAEPLQRLRRDALAVATGEPPAAERGRLPIELEPIHGALSQAAADVEAGQRAQRVLAWGEMARQVAHEIKNPLTPIRLGIQHLLRLGRERPGELGTALGPTGERILVEIDRLDSIARGFSRLGLPGSEGLPLEPVDLAAVAEEVAHLYRMGKGTTEWRVESEAGARGLTRRDELVEVLVNLCENARDAGASRVVIRARRGEPAMVEVDDDGRGIAADVLPRVFEPRFSTTTSGTGLGLAIARRLVEGWGGTISIASEPGRGTTVRLSLIGERA